MKNSPYLRWFLLGLLVHAILYILGIILFPIYFPLRKPIARHKTWFLWWFLNSDEGDYVSNTYGDEAYRKRRGFDYEKASVLRKIYEGFIWNAIRNSHWNFRVHVLVPKVGKYWRIEIKKNDTTPATGGMTFCNYTIWGVQHATYYIEDVKYFRYSFTKRTPKLLRWIGFRPMWNLHSGWASNRWILKLRWFRPE